MEITAQAGGYSSGSASVSVLDKSFCYVAVTVTPDAFAEGQGPFVAAGGVVVACSGHSGEHLLLRHAQLADLMLESLGGGMNTTPELGAAVGGRLTAGLPASFSGAGATGFSAPDCEAAVHSLLNGAAAIMNRGLGDGHVVMIGTDFGNDVPAFDRVLANAVRLGLTRVPAPCLPSRPPRSPSWMVSGLASCRWRTKRSTPACWRTTSWATMGRRPSSI